MITLEIKEYENRWNEYINSLFAKNIHKITDKTEEFQSYSKDINLLF